MFSKMTKKHDDRQKHISNKTYSNKKIQTNNYSTKTVWQKNAVQTYSTKIFDSNHSKNIYSKKQFLKDISLE